MKYSLLDFLCKSVLKVVVKKKKAKFDKTQQCKIKG